MSFDYKNPLSSSQLTGTQSVARTSTFGTNFSVLNVGGYMEVYNLIDLELTLTAATYPSWRSPVAAYRSRRPAA